VAIARLEQGNLPNVKGGGEGVLEYRINFGPGYRVYFGRDGNELVILLTGGTKSGSSGTFRRRSNYGRITGGADARGERRSRWH
jgi:putative addiction module killer protein